MSKKPVIALAHADTLDTAVSSLFRDALRSKGATVGDTFPRDNAVTSDSEVTPNCILVLYDKNFEQQLSERGTTAFALLSNLKRLQDRAGARVKISNQISNQSVPAGPTDRDPLVALASEKQSVLPEVVIVFLDDTDQDCLPLPLRPSAKYPLIDFDIGLWRSTGQLRAGKTFRHVFDLVITSAVNRAQVNLESQRKAYLRRARALFDAMFVKLKHDNSDFDDAVFEKIFVKTREFFSFDRQSAYILIGRKGSGKSTIVDYIARKPTIARKWPIVINVNTMPLEYIYNIVLSAKHPSDHKYVLVRELLMEFAWEALLHYCCLEALKKESELGTLAAKHSKHMPTLKTYMDRLVKNPHFIDIEFIFSKYRSSEFARRNAFFVLALTAAVEFVSQSIADAPLVDQEFNFFVAKSMTPEHYLAHAFPTQVLSSFYAVLEACDRQFLIALDGFDSQIQLFRSNTFRNYRDTEAARSRHSFEVDWLRGLIDAVRRCKAKRGANPLAGRIDFCITVPEDRYFEVLEYDRDRYQIQGATLSISWSGVELAQLIRKRIELHCDTETIKSDKPLKRLRGLLKSEFPDLPMTIPVQLNNRTIEVDLFHYILRHTFWRPRDVLFFWGQIIALYEHLQEQGFEMNADSVKSQVARLGFYIIETEFISEFKDYVGNLEVIVKLFEGKHQAISFDEFRSILKGYEPQLAFQPVLLDNDGRSQHRTTLSWIEILYRIGFIGFYLQPNCPLKARFETPWIYIHNEGDVILKMIKTAHEDRILITIHPIFVEYLALNAYKEQLVCEMSDEYLIRQEGRQMSHKV